MQAKKKSVIWMFAVMLLLVLVISVSSRENYFDKIQEESRASITEKTGEVKNYEGYIIEFKKAPVVEKKIELDKEIKGLKLKTEIEEKEKEKSEILSDYNEKLKAEHRSALNDIQNKLGGVASLNPLRKIIDFFKNLFITGRATGTNVENKLTPKREFYYVFNGIALDISDEDAEKIKQSEYVKNVYKNMKVKTLLDSSIPAMDINLARDYAGLTGEGITIAVIDTGIDASHESLDDLDDNPLTNDPKIIGWKDYVNFEPEPYDDHGHGTHVSGIATGTGGEGVYKGVAPKSFA